MSKFNPQNSQSRQNGDKSVSNPPNSNTTRLLSALGIAVFQQLKAVLYAAIAALRAQVIIYTNKKAQNFLRGQFFINDLDNIYNIVNAYGAIIEFIDRLPIGAVKGIPGLYNTLKTVKDYGNQGSYQARKYAYVLNQMNNKQLYYDYLVQQLDELIRDLRGIVEWIEGELETGTT